jgi:hypothetical protein
MYFEGCGDVKDVLIETDKPFLPQPPLTPRNPPYSFCDVAMRFLLLCPGQTCPL